MERIKEAKIKKATRFAAEATIVATHPLADAADFERAANLFALAAEQMEGMAKGGAAR